MAFEKGNNYGKGRPKGSTNTKTDQWNKFAEWFMSDGMDRLQEEMSKLEGKDFVREVKDLMEYFQPKLQRTETDITSKGNEIQIPTINFEQPKENNDK